MLQPYVSSYNAPLHVLVGQKQNCGHDDGTVTSVLIQANFATRVLSTAVPVFKRLRRSAYWCDMCSWLQKPLPDPTTGKSTHDIP